MPLLRKNVASQYVFFMAWDTANSVGKTGDSGNFTLKWILDGSSGAAAGTVSEVDSTNCPGLYKYVATQGETNGLTFCLHGKSSTSNIVLQPVSGGTDQGYFAALQADTDDIQGRLPAALVSGRMDASVGAYQTGLTPLQPTTAGRTLDVTATGEAGIDWANIGGPTTVVNLSGTSVKTATDVETDTQDIQGRLPAALVSGRVDASVGAMASGVVTATAIAADAIGASELATDAVDEIAAAILLTPANKLAVDSNNCPTARSLDSGLSRASTAQAGGASSITLDSGASSVDDFFVGQRVRIYGGTGVGQTRIILAYNGTTKVATVHRAWKTNPDNTSTFAIYSDSVEGLQYLDTLLSTINTAVASVASSLSTVATNVSTALNRIGSWTGTGVNTILGGIKAICSKTASLPSDIGGSFDNTTDSLQAIVDNGVGGGSGGTTLLSPTVTFSQVAAALSGSANDGGMLTFRIGTTNSLQLTGLGDISDRTKLYVTVKADPDDADADAILQWEESAGLLRLNGAATTSSWGSLTVADQSTDASVTILLKHNASVSLARAQGLWYDVKSIVSTESDALTIGRARILPTVTKAIS